MVASVFPVSVVDRKCLHCACQTRRGIQVVSKDSKARVRKSYLIEYRDVTALQD